MKKTLSMIIASCTLASSMVPVFAADTFKDVNSKSYAWAYEYVENMADKGLVSGYEDGTFRPGNTVSRMEAFALFARLMGSNNSANTETLDAAKELYKDILKDYELSYAEGDVAYMLYRGVITEEELDTYFKGTKKSEAMPRYEAAILITKAMLAEEDAKAEVLIDMDYTDTKDIPGSAKQYVYYVSQKGIMSGMGDGKFSPNTAVLRGQIAVMLSKTVDASSYFTETVPLVSIDTASKNLTIRDGEDQKIEIGYNEDTKFYVDGKLSNDKSLSAGQIVTLTYTQSGGAIVLSFADAKTSQPDDFTKLIYKGYTSNAGQIKLLLQDPETAETKSYNCSQSVVITIDGDVSEINKLNSNDYVAVGMKDGTVLTVKTLQKRVIISEATLKMCDLIGTVTINHEDEEYDEQTYTLGSDAEIIRNKKEAELSDLRRGDQLDITLDYGIITQINATAQKRTVEGTIRSYTIAQKSTITIRSEGKDYTYDLPAKTPITINGQDAKLADFEIGAKVKVSLESDTVTKIEGTQSEAEASSTMVTGKVTATNSETKTIVIESSEGGEVEEIYINCTDNTRYQVVPTLSTYSFKSIKIGDTVTAYGEYSDGIFVGTGIVVIPQGK